MKVLILRVLRYLYRNIPLPLGLKCKLKFRFFKLINAYTAPDISASAFAKEIIDPAIERAEVIRYGHELSFPPVDGPPDVSIIVPVFNNFAYTMRCLSSIINTSSSRTYEVIVVDDCSSDNTEQELSNVAGLKYSRNNTNGGFIVSCNNGASQATGDYLVFLNNDTVVLPGWLDSMLEVFENRPDTGLVGSMLLYPDGRLQEAGGIVWRDGSAWNFGRLSDPMSPEFNYLRQADYCSGACICVKSGVFDRLGGFDPVYMPAYYEDTDLAFRMRQAGLSVYYQPASKIVHFEGVSSGVDTSSGVKKYQVANQEKFFDRWAATLKTHNKNGVDANRERDRGAVRRMLIIDACTPTPDKDSGSVRMFAFMKLLVKRGVKVVFIPSNLAFDEKYTRELQAEGVEALYHPYVSSIENYLKTNGSVFDCVLLSRVYVANSYMLAVKKYCPQATVIFDTVDLHFIRERRQAEVERDDKKMKAAEEQRELELSFVNQSDITLVVSEIERGVIRDELASENKSSCMPRVEVLSNIHQVCGRNAGYDERRGILFIGGYDHTPNVDAVQYFCETIFPLIRSEEQDIEFYIIGSHVPDEVKALEGDGVHVVGYVEDIQPYFEKIRLSVAPLRYGAGVKGKINSSMSYGVPVVSTTLGVEGMGLNDDEVVVADDPASFANAVLNVNGDRELWERLSDGGIKNVERNFSPEMANDIITSICDIEALSNAPTKVSAKEVIV